jgi:lipopolysaccharide heptosyltransferase I
MDDILIIRLSSLGDIIHTLPAFAALRRSFPEARIRWAVEERGKNILDLVPGIDEVIVIGRKIWRQNIKAVRRRDQTAVDFQGLVKSALLAYFSRSRQTIGFSKENCKEPLAASFYSERLPPFPDEEIHVIAKNLRLLSLVGIREERFDFPISVPDELRDSVLDKLKAIGYARGQKLLVFNVGAAWETKRWFPERWAEAIAKTRFTDAYPLILWGNEAERRLALAVSEKTEVPLAPLFSVKEVLALLQMTSLLVSGDTFALQAACAFSIPVVGLFGPTNPRRNGPFEARDKVIFSKKDCNPCYKKTCSTPECLQAITAEDVVTAVKELWPPT